MTIRLACVTDLPRIVDIYNQAVETGFLTADTEPTSVESRLDWFDSHTADYYPVYIDEHEGEIRGWCSLSPYRKGRLGLRYTAEISYYVNKSYQRQRIATRLIEHALNDCARLNLKTLFAIILDSNRGSIALLEKLGFEQWGHMPGVADFNGVECGHTYLGLRLSS